MHILISWILSALAIVVAAYVLPGVSVDGFLTAVVVAVVLGFVNAVLRPILIFLTLPITIITLGLFTLVIQTFLILLTAWLVPGFEVAGFWWALLFGLVLWVLNVFIRASSVLTPRAVVANQRW